ncbi:uncharacterized protein HMPREF1541_05112 [Cyphellophora europaea CBS 101466]|uniref:CRIB domain-containing protein n=1 Tax=Cyphellophora europaea (strain CBS 101466) TaxID=1220924 RepID=W2RWK9_CYPE1|nr:uncharacterized protein HMPREF1541_05112 [Cyphellophora europaea CBS 101466]ETN40832.1 hypothetical protein HMPREF1541_05112 [Cyphellophora europaea CBS 101466]
MEETEIGPPRSERMSKHFLSKGSRMVRRQTSKFNVLATQQDDPKDSRSTGIARVRSAGHLLNLHSSRRSEFRPQISGPFDFQHVSHTNQSQYQDLTKSAKTDLADSFSALQADQAPGQEIKGIPVADLPSSTPSIEQTSATPQSPTFSIVPSLPSTPPKPAPPPKDLPMPPSLGADVRFSRSMDNFSWPTRSPQLETDQPFMADSQADIAGDEAPMVTANLAPSPGKLPGPETGLAATVPNSPRQLTYSELLDKPLPQPPTVVHAVSTVDDSTLPMKIAPLPQVPSQSPEMSSPVITDAEALDPTRPRLSAGIRPQQLPQAKRTSRHRSPSNCDTSPGSTFGSAAGTLASPPSAARNSKRISVGIKKIDVDDWEDAIDYSWDHAFDVDDDMDMVGESMTKSDYLPQTFDFGPQRTASAMQLSSLGSLPAPPMRAYKSDMNLQGLGINAARPENGVAGGLDYEEYSDKHDSLKVPFVRREPGSPISKSSSQESIILSIASSIMSTHRSSNSSTSLGDFGQLASIEDEGTLPPDDKKMLASGSGSVSSSDTVTVGPQAEDTAAEDKIVELPDISHHRGASTSRVPTVPNRSSSVAQAAKSAPRKRSSTLNSGRRLNTRASYSLFPNAQAVPPAN